MSHSHALALSGATTHAQQLLDEQKQFARAPRDTEFAALTQRYNAMREQLSAERSAAVAERDAAHTQLKALHTELEDAKTQLRAAHALSATHELQLTTLQREVRRWKDQVEVGAVDAKAKEKQMLTEQIAELDKKNEKIRELNKLLLAAAREKEEAARVTKDLKEK